MKFYYNFCRKIAVERTFYFVMLIISYVIVVGYMFQRNFTSEWKPSELFLYVYNALYFTVLFPFVIFLLNPVCSMRMTTEIVRANQRMEKAGAVYLFCLVILFGGIYVTVHKIGNLLFGLSDTSFLQYVEVFGSLVLQTWAYGTVYRCFLFSKKKVYYLMAIYFLITFLDCYFLGMIDEYSWRLPLYSFVSGNRLKSSFNLIFLGMILAFYELRNMLAERRDSFDSKI